MGDQPPRQAPTFAKQRGAAEVKESIKAKRKDTLSAAEEGGNGASHGPSGQVMEPLNVSPTKNGKSAIPLPSTGSSPTAKTTSPPPKLASSVSTPQRLDQHAEMWLEYNKMADKEDSDFVKASHENLNSLLIFAGIFAAINVSFILETFKSLKIEPQDITNELILAQINLQNPNHSLSLPSAGSFHPTNRDVRTNLAFFSSLCTSLACSFLAVTSKQWLSNYENERSLKPPAERARERHQKFEGRVDFHLQGAVESLPILLQVALLVFLGGLADLLWPLERSVSICVIASLCVIFTTSVSLTIIATFYPRFPYQTRPSIVFRRVVDLLREKVGSPPVKPTDATSVRVIGHLLKNTTHNDSRMLNILADCFDLIPSKEEIKKLGDIIVQFHFTPLLVATVEEWNDLKSTTIREEFRSLGMLQIVRGLIKHKGSLDISVRNAIISRVYLLSWQTELDDAHQEVVADILAFGLDQMGEMWAKPVGDLPLKRHQRWNLEIKFVDRLCDEVIGNALQTTSGDNLSYLFKSLPEGYSGDAGISRILSRLADFYEALSDGDSVSISILEKKLMGFCLARFSSGGAPQSIKVLPKTTKPPSEEEFCSAPMLRIIAVLLRHKMEPEVRKSVLYQIWELSHKRKKGKEPVHVARASIIAQHVLDLEGLIGGDGPSGKRSFNQSQRGHLVDVTSFLCTRLMERRLEKYASEPCLNLLYHCVLNRYAADGVLIKLLGKLFDFYATLSMDEESISTLLNVTAKFCREALGDDGRKSPIRVGGAGQPGSNREFHSTLILRIIYTLLRRLTLESEAYEEILSYILHVAQQKDVDSDQAEMIVKIIALEVEKVDELRRSVSGRRSSPSSSQNHNMLISLASQMISGLEKEPPDQRATRLWMNLFCDRLDAKSLENVNISAILEKLANKLPTLIDIDSTSAILLAKKLMEIRLGEFGNTPLQRSSVTGAQQPTHDGFWSTPMLKILHVLFRRSILQGEAQKSILFYVWRLPQQEVGGDRAAVIADIIASSEPETVAQLLKEFPWLLSVGPQYHPHVAVELALRLNSRLDGGGLTEEAKQACFYLRQLLPSDAL